MVGCVRENKTKKRERFSGSISIYSDLPMYMYIFLLVDAGLFNSRSSSLYILSRLKVAY